MPWLSPNGSHLSTKRTISFNKRLKPSKLPGEKLGVSPYIRGLPRIQTDLLFAMVSAA
jgi:hypothetical protein